MKIIELIRIRTGSGNSEKLLETLQQITAEAMLGVPKGTVKLFQEDSIAGDFAYFLFWEAESIKAEGTDLGIKITKTLGSLGIVDYTKWTLIKTPPVSGAISKADNITKGTQKVYGPSAI
jgi:hypothetical protein